MSIDKTIKKLLPSAISLVACLGFITGINFCTHHNVSYETDNKKVFQKANGILAHTQIEVNKDGSVAMNRYNHIRGIRFYTDNDGDGKVDRVIYAAKLFSRGPHSETFYRDEHLEHYPQVFETADQDFRQQMKRFKPLMNR